jgi:protein phosphatase
MPGTRAKKANAMTPFKIQVGCQSVVGNYRENNEDNVFSDLATGLFIVADGMGGQLAGEQASKMAVENGPKRLHERLAGVTGDKQIAEAVRQAILDANRDVMELAARHPEFQSMGTTVVLALVVDRTVFIAGLGDSRAYHIRPNKSIKQLTTDHSLAQALFEAGTIAASEVKDHRFRNILWKYLGSKEVGVGPDIAMVNPAVGDRFVLATDGTYGVLADADIQNIVTNEPDPQKAAEALVNLALQNNSRDNASCITLYLD